MFYIYFRLYFHCPEILFTRLIANLHTKKKKTMKIIDSIPEVYSEIANSDSTRLLEYISTKS